MSFFGSENKERDQRMLGQYLEHLPYTMGDKNVLENGLKLLDAKNRDIVLNKQPLDPDFKQQCVYIDDIANGRPDIRHVENEKALLEWAEELGDDAIDGILDTLFEQKSHDSDGLITVTRKDYPEDMYPTKVRYATFPYDHIHVGDRETIEFQKEGKTFVKCNKVLRDKGPGIGLTAVWDVAFPESMDKELFEIDKSICVFIADDV